MSNTIPLKDLRVGNLVLSDTYTRIEHIVDNVFGNKFVQIELEAIDIASIGDSRKNVFGIPITEEWLEKFGFNRLTDDEHEVRFDCPNAIPYSYFDLEYLCIWSYEGDIKLSKKCEYVHDLQNCFYFLTGIGLILK